MEQVQYQINMGDGMGSSDVLAMSNQLRQLNTHEQIIQQGLFKPSIMTEQEAKIKQATLEYSFDL